MSCVTPDGEFVRLAVSGDDDGADVHRLSGAAGGRRLTPLLACRFRRLYPASHRHAAGWYDGQWPSGPLPTGQADTRCPFGLASNQAPDEI
jgi:hypothetical protein